MKKYKYLVTGAAGFIGFHLSKKLLELGCEVIGYDNINDYYDVNLKYKRLEILNCYNHFKFYQENLENKEKLENVFKENNIDIVIHLAAQAGVRYSIENPDVYIQSNLVGFANILEMCRHYNVKHLLYASSSSVYGANKKTPFSLEDMVDNPISLYAATKKSNELMAYTYSHLYDIPTTGLRFFTVYGEYGRPDMAYYSFTKNILEGEAIKVFNNGDMKRDFTYIDDIVDGIVKLVESPVVFSLTPKYKLYNIGNSRPEDLLHFIELLEQYTGEKAIKEFFPMQPGDVYETYADITEIHQDIGFKPSTDIKVGLKKFVEWYKEYYS